MNSAHNGCMRHGRAVHLAFSHFTKYPKESVRAGAVLEIHELFTGVLLSLLVARVIIPQRLLPDTGACFDPLKRRRGIVDGRIDVRGAHFIGQTVRSAVRTGQGCVGA